jgi:methylenetetrahydrofolate dehydrogenase (NADP+)/methenyltetrahydrofolate cyclohydrolase
LTTRVLSGKEVAAAVESEVAARAAALERGGARPGLATLRVGDDPSSAVYVRNKHTAAGRVGIESFDHHLPAETPQAEVERFVEGLNEDPAVDAFIVQLPLPPGIDAQQVLERIDPGKDADGLHPVNLGRLVLERPVLTPATPTGILRILDHYRIETAGVSVVVVGRSFLVGRPLALMLGLRGRDATVTVAHSRTRDLAGITRRADILVAAVGRPQMFDAGYIRPGGVVIDVGTTRSGGALVGDVDFDAALGVAGSITPVPGGVGPMTIASLLLNTISAAEARRG